jgi:hypothetical protein
MSKLYHVYEKMNNIRVKLYPNHLKKVDGLYIARNESETPLNIEDIVAYMKKRAGFTGSTKDAIDHVKMFLTETMYQLCNGKSVDMDYYSIYPNVGGSFNSVDDERDLLKNPVSFRFRCRKAMRELAKDTGVIITALADGNARIKTFIDQSNDAENKTIMSGKHFVIIGRKIKIEGDDPQCGVYFESVTKNAQNPQRIKVEERLIQNNSGKIIGIVPKLRAHSKYKVVILSQHTTATTLLKAPRTIVSGFVLETA